MRQRISSALFHLGVLSLALTAVLLVFTGFSRSFATFSCLTATLTGAYLLAEHPEMRRFQRITTVTMVCVSSIAVLLNALAWAVS